MAQDVFAATQVQYGGAFSAKDVTLNVKDLDVALIQSLQGQHAQNLTRLYEIGKDNQKSRMYYVAGRSQGQLGLARVLGPASGLGAFYERYGDVCQASKNTMTLHLNQVNCDANAGGQGGRSSYTCKFCVVTQIGFAVAAQDMIVNENMAIIFAGMEYDGS